MLSSASKGKDLPEKQLVVLGGTSDQQREFLEQLNSESSRPRYGNDRKKNRTVPISNRYALGYTYHDVLDADQEDTLARLNIYMLANPTAAFAPLLTPLFTTKTVKDTLIIILLDWSDPFKWARQLRQWIRLLRSVIMSLNDETKIEMEEHMTAWRERKVGPDAPSTQPGAAVGEQRQMPTIPLGPGEWDEGLGIPLSVICIQAEKIEMLERDHGWQEDQFDFLMQWLRTVLLKHGASLVYTATFDSNNVRTLLHSSLSIQSLLKRDIAKHNVIDRDKILVPPNWDSWGKIRILKEGFDPETLGEAWSTEIQQAPEKTLDFTMSNPDENSAVAIFESTLPAPPQTSTNPNTSTEITVTVPSVQDFLSSQHAILSTLQAEDEKGTTQRPRANRTASALTGSSATEPNDSNANSSRMAEQIGPYQINVNGIDFDAEEATRRLRERENARKNEERGTPSGLSTPTKRREGSGATAEDGKPSNEAMSAFFANLIKKGAGAKANGSASPTKERGSPAPDRGRERERERTG